MKSAINANPLDGITGMFATYNGGGYVMELGSSPQGTRDVLDYIHSEAWIDSSTAAVITEFSIYTANVNLLSLITVSMEIPPIGGVWPNYKINTMKMYYSTSGLHYFVVIFQIIYCLYTLYFIVYEIRRIHRYKNKYFQNAWNLLELGAIMCSLSVISLYTAHAVEIDKAVKVFNTSGARPQAFHTALVLDRVLMYMFALLVTIGMVKFLHLLRFNPLIYRFGCIIRKAVVPLTFNVVLMLIIFMAYGMFMILVGGHEVRMFQNIKMALRSLFTAMMGEFDLEELEQLHPIFGPLLILVFMFITMIVLVNMTMIMLCVALSDVNMSPQPLEDTELLWLLIDNIKQWLGITSLRPSYSRSQHALPGQHTTQRGQSNITNWGHSKARIDGVLPAMSRYARRRTLALERAELKNLTER